MCVYCGGPADSTDHTPPRCFLPRKLATTLQAMTVPACKKCNGGYSLDELRAAAIICTVSFTKGDREAIEPGGWLHAEFARDRSLKKFIDTRLGSDGVFRPDEEALNTLSRVIKKTAVGLLLHEFGLLVRPPDLQVVALDHSHNIHASALVESKRRTDSGWAEVTPSGRELERQVMATFGLPPRNSSPWKVYIPQFFEYTFLRGSNGTLLCGFKLHDALTAVLECPWPSAAGPRRRGKPPRRLPDGT